MPVLQTLISKAASNSVCFWLAMPTIQKSRDTEAAKANISEVRWKADVSEYPSYY